jgi:hypothetical protein
MASRNPTKAKGDRAELEVASDLLRRGYKIAFPYGEDWDFDLILCRDERLERVQVKYTTSDGNVVMVRCRSHSLTNGKVKRVKRYTSRTVDWLAIYDSTSDRCYYVPAAELGDGRSMMHLRLKPAANGQLRGIRFADDYLDPNDPSQQALIPENSLA